LSAKTRLQNTTPVASKASRNSILSPSNFLTPIRPIGFYSLWLHLFFLSEFPGLALLAKKPRTAARGGQMATESLAPVRHAWIVIVLLQSRPLSAEDGKQESSITRAPGAVCPRQWPHSAHPSWSSPDSYRTHCAAHSHYVAPASHVVHISSSCYTSQSLYSRSLHNAPSTTPTSPLTPERP
jgi:hypothetical protein